MALHRAILEMGAGNDLHGGDYTKAAIRAVEDALHHSSLTFIRALGIDKDTLQVDVTIGVQKPDEVDTEKVKGSLPVGKVSVRAVKGGLDVEDEVVGDVAVIASAAVEVRIER
ncbi:MAG: Lin0512 family protein [Alphaproteobacteria bacterium]|nr:Lin0512 family protein [Alphaproteobacteria bacterium]MEC7204599.1 Lin0512 family protein [Pseudomonadota bacterium]MEC8698591.1 Lin0512 family protein [Pseudomonadota bacterium]MED5357447.1 Lin0512 family protein [Pseudomonadota bacterium]MED6310183.1 Lin0512 family protein [Pseudomonadota bacterium]